MSTYELFDPEVHSTQVQRVSSKITPAKARASLPDVLSLKIVEDRLGIFTKYTLPQATQFGPLEAPLTRNEVEGTNLLIKLDLRKCGQVTSNSYSRQSIYFDTTDENQCNWMMFVQSAKFYAEQNTCAHQVGGFIFFTTTREISVGDELKVWYSPTYAKFMSAPLLKPNAGHVGATKVNAEKRKTRKVKATRSQQVAANLMLLGRDVRSVPPKKRGWRRTKDKRVDIIDRNVALGYQVHGPPVVQKTHMCQICHKLLKDSTKLKTHMVIHSSERNFLCHSCGATFKRSDKLNDHMTNVHENSKPCKPFKPKPTKNLDKYPFKCVDCQTGFWRRGMLVNHLIKRHPDVRTNDVEELARPIYRTVRDFLCPYCEKVYKSHTKRKLHIQKQHPGNEVPASLKKKKGATTVRSDDVSIVAKETIPTDPVCCPYCNRQYSARNKRDKHIRDKHPFRDNQPTMARSSSEQAEVNEIPPVYDVDASEFPDIGQQELSSNLTTNVPVPVPQVQPHPEPQVYPILQISNSTDSVSPVQYCTQNTNQQTLSSELTATDRVLLNQAMSELEPSTSSTQQQQHYTDFQTAAPKRSRYSIRYPLGHKRMLLKSYKDSQDQLQLSQNSTEVPAVQPGKQMPYKARLLGSEPSWRTMNCPDGQATSPITELRQSTQQTSQEYSSLHSQPSLVMILRPSVTGETMVLNDNSALGEPEMTMVNPYQNPGPSGWSYPQGYDAMHVNSSYVALESDIPLSRTNSSA